MRILSPLNGNSLTISFPIIDREHIKDLVYSPRSNKIFMLLKNKEIWILASDVNPCIVVDVWKRHDETDDECIALTLLEGVDMHTWPHLRTMSAKASTRRRSSVFRRSTTIKREFESLRGETLETQVDIAVDRARAPMKGFSFLIGATPKGQLIVYGRKAKVVYRCPVHQGPISALVTDPCTGTIYSGSLADQTIKMTLFDPTADDVFEVRRTICTHVSPVMICPSPDFLAMATPDGSVSIHSMSLQHPSTPAHAKMEDHNLEVTALIFLRKQNIFLSAGLDGVLKVWDSKGNRLLREIQFADPILGTLAGGCQMLVIHYL